MFKVMSYNLWFDTKDQVKRLESLLAVISEHDSDIICLQEVIPDVYNLLKRILKDYKYSYPKKIDKSYGCAIFSKYKANKCEEYVYYRSSMGRSLLTMQIMVNKHKILVATTHYESLFKKKEENTVKLGQYNYSKEILDKEKKYNDLVILCADTNILPKEEKQFFGGHGERCSDKNGWHDCWEYNCNENIKYTYDYKTNENVKNKGSMKFRSRLDRILYNGEVILNNFDLITGIDGLIQPSDHHGIIAEFCLFEDKIEI